MPGTTGYSAALDQMYEHESPPSSRERAASDCGSSSTGSVEGELSTPSNSKQSSGDGLIPTRSTKLSTSKPPYNPLQFIKVGPAQLAQKAQEQIKKTQEVRDVRKLSREDSEEWQEMEKAPEKIGDDWQTNLDNWKSARRKRVEDVIERVQEMKQIEYEEHERKARKNKTFSEMMQDRGSRGGRINLSLYTEDDDDAFFSTSKDEESTMKTNGEHTEQQQHASDNSSETHELSQELHSKENGPNGDTSFESVNGEHRVNGNDEHEFTYDKAIENYVKYAQAQNWSTDKLNGNTSYSSSDKDSVCSETETKITQRHTVFETRGRKSETAAATEKQSTDFKNKVASFNSGDIGRSVSDADIPRKMTPSEVSETFRKKLASFNSVDLQEKNDGKSSKVEIHKPEFHNIRNNFEKQEVGQVEVKKITPDRDISFKNKRQSFVNKSVSQVEVKKITPERDASFKSKLASFSEQNVSSVEVRKISAERDASFKTKLAAFSEQNIQEVPIRKVTPERDSTFKDKLASFTSMEESGSNTKLSPSRSVDIPKALLREEQSAKRAGKQAFERTQSLSHIPDRFIDDLSDNSGSSDEELLQIAKASDHLHSPRPALHHQSSLSETRDSEIHEPEDPKPPSKTNFSDIPRPQVKPPLPPTSTSREDDTFQTIDNSSNQSLTDEKNPTLTKYPLVPLDMPEIPPIVTGLKGTQLHSKSDSNALSHQKKRQPSGYDGTSAKENLKKDMKSGKEAIPGTSASIRSSSLDRVDDQDSARFSLRRRNNSASFVDVDFLAQPQEEPIIEPTHVSYQPQEDPDISETESDFQKIAAEAKLQDNPEDRLDFLLRGSDLSENSVEEPSPVLQYKETKKEPTQQPKTPQSKQPIMHPKDKPPPPPSQIVEAPIVRKKLTIKESIEIEDELEDEMIVHNTEGSKTQSEDDSNTDNSSESPAQLVGVQLDEASQQLLAGETVMEFPLVLGSSSMKEPPKEKPPPPPVPPPEQSCPEIIHTRTSSKELKKDLWRRRSDFLGLNWKESETNEDEDAMPNLPSAVEAVIRAERKLVQESKQNNGKQFRFENFSASKVPTEKSPKSDRRSWVATHQAHKLAANQNKSPTSVVTEAKSSSKHYEIGANMTGVTERSMVQSGSLNDVRANRKQDSVISMEPMAGHYRSSSYPDLDAKGKDESSDRVRNAKDTSQWLEHQKRTIYQEAYNNEIIHRYQNINEIGYKQDRVQEAQLYSTQYYPHHPDSMHPHFTTTPTHQQHYSSQEHEYPTQDHRFSPQQQHYSSQDHEYPTQDHHYSPQQQQYPSQEHEYPSHDQYFSPKQQQYPSQEHEYSTQDHHFSPKQQHYSQEQHYPQQGQHYQEELHYPQEQRYPQQEQHYPQQEQRFHQQGQHFPQEEQHYPHYYQNPQHQFHEEQQQRVSQYSSPVQQQLSPQENKGYRVESARMYSSEDDLHELIDKGVVGELPPPPVPAKPPRKFAENDRPRRKKDINKHWIVQEAEQRRIDEQEIGKDRLQQNFTQPQDQGESRIPPTNPQPLYANQPVETSHNYVNVQGSYSNGALYADYVNVAAAQRYATGHIHSSSVPAPSPGLLHTNTTNTEKALPDSVIKTITQRVHTKQASNAQPWSPVYENLPFGNGVTPAAPPSAASGPPMLSVSGKKKCSSCGQELGRGAAMIIESLRLFYHLGCFRCCVCNQQLGNGTAGADVRVRNNRLHCHNCYSNDQGLKFSKV